jgi:hypothetical protein
MKIKLAFALLAVSTLSAEDSYWAPISAPPNPIVGRSTSAVSKTAEKFAFVGSSDLVFPHIAAGGGWETVIVIVNMSVRTMEYRTYFYDDAGKPMRVTFKNYPEGRTETDSGIISRLPLGASFNFSLFDTGGPTQVGWAVLDYDTTVGRLGGYAIFRQRIAGRTAIPEALVPLSAADDTAFFMPFDNIQGFDTAMAIVNPAANLDNQINFTFLGLNSSIIGRAELTLPPGGHIAFTLRDKFPLLPLSHQLGTVIVESSLNRLSAIGIRFNDTGTFASIPIMNWADMF